MIGVNPLECKILVLGYRWALIEKLHRRGLSFAVWAAKKPKRKKIDFRLYVAPFPKKKTPLLESYVSFFGPESFTHVLACTEESVVPASHLRAFFGVKRFPKQIARRCHNKIIMKKFLHRKHIPMSTFMVSPKDPDALEKNLGLPCISKLANLSGGKSFLIHPSKESLQPWCQKKRIFESFLEGKEYSVESLIRDREIVFENVTEYYEKGRVNILPGHLPDEVKRVILDLNQKVVRDLGIVWGLTHAEFFVGPKGVFFGEIALRPPGGYIMELISLAYGEDFWGRFLDVELGIPFTKIPEPKYVVASVMDHQRDEGYYEKPKRWESLQNMKSTVKARHVVKIGQTLSKQQSISDLTGYVIHRCKDRQEVLDAIESTRSIFRGE
ncbi:MAG: hypothetical protein R3A11_02985 [Bdellovibrionota bacterium]